MLHHKETPLLGLPEVAKRLGLHRATVNDMVHDGRIPACRIGPHWYIDENDFENFALSYERPRNSPRRAPRRVEPSPEIIALIGEWGEASVAEIQEIVQLHEGNIRKHLCIAEAQGLAERDEHGRWRLTPAGISGSQKARNTRT